jgi:glycosyltransferase involved in cell wall biosynthesis
MNNINTPLIRTTIYIGEYTLIELIKERQDVDTKWNKPHPKKRICIAGTYPVNQSNGYSKVVYYTAKHLAKYEDIELTIYGFQNFKQINGGQSRNDIPSNVKLHDALATENPKRSGFGEKEIGTFLKENPQDVIIIFNDSIITSALTACIINELPQQRSKFKLISYIDQVYPFQKPEYIDLLNKHYDAIIAFTPYWRDIAYKIGIKQEMPVYIYPHGFDYNLNFPIQTKYARNYFNIDEDAFCILNLNRNQPRKQFDVCMIAMVMMMKRHYMVNVEGHSGKVDGSVLFKTNKYTKRPIKFLIGTNADGYWNLDAVLKHECMLQEVPYEYAKKCLWECESPQQLSDRDVNILQSACDIGVNSCAGGGYELTVIEGIGIGKPQVCAFVGGIREYIEPYFSCPIEPCFRQYGDLKGKGIGVLSELTDPKEYFEGFWKYYSNPELCEKHGKKGREHIIKNYKWETVVEMFYNECLTKL